MRKRKLTVAVIGLLLLSGLSAADGPSRHIQPTPAPMPSVPIPDPAPAPPESFGDIHWYPS